MGVLRHHGTKVALLAAAAAAATTATASTTISTDFYGTAVEANRLLSTDVAGAPSYAASNWNLLSGATIEPTAAVSLYDSDGSSTGVAISISNGPGRLHSFGGSPATGNAKLYNGAVGRDHWFSALTFTLTGLDLFDSYDLIVYTEADYADANRIARVTTSAAGSPIYYGHAPANTLGTAPFTQISSTDPLSPSDGNYMVFNGLTDDSLTLTFSAPDNYVYLTGFQVVGAVPEPMALSTLALALPAMLRRRRAR